MIFCGSQVRLARNPKPEVEEKKEEEVVHEDNDWGEEYKMQNE